MGDEAAELSEAMARVALAARLLLLHPIRASLSSSPSASRPPQILCLKSWIEGLGPRRLTRAAALDCKFLNRRLSDTRNFSLRGGKFGLGGAFLASLAARIITSRPVVAYSFDDDETSVDIEGEDLAGSLNGEDSRRVIWNAGKLWLPVFFVLTVLLSLDQPIQLAVKVVLFLLSTKPSPLSVYLFIEQMRSRSMLQEPHVSRLQSLHANKVEVRDYKLLCLARVEMRDQKLTLLGILGGWWKLPLSPGSGAFLLEY